MAAAAILKNEKIAISR